MLDLNRIYNMDCLEGMRELPDKCIDLTVTSPPYDDLREYNGYTFNFEETAKELYRITKDGGVIVWVVGDATINGSETGTSFKQALYFKEIGFNLHDTMVYQKNCYPFPPSNRYFGVFEYMFIFSKKTPKTFNPIRVPTKWENNKKTNRMPDGTMKRMEYDTGKYTRIKENVWKYEVGFSKSSKDEIAFEHPATFPEQLAQDHIQSWSDKNDVVLDPFMGSGTVAKIAIINERQFIGFEIAEPYYNIAQLRIKKAQEQGKITEWF